MLFVSLRQRGAEAVIELREKRQLVADKRRKTRVKPVKAAKRRAQIFFTFFSAEKNIERKSGRFAPVKFVLLPVIGSSLPIKRHPFGAV